jgi:YHS domain-containing protein
MKKVLVLMFMALAFTITLSAQQTPVFIESGKAIRGYDPVAYFTEQKPVLGNDAYKYSWNNATWYFASQDNLDLFKAAPEKYAPQYGGYCAYGMSNGYKAPTDADAWSIVNNKLYLNYNINVRKDWNNKQLQLIAKADKNWPSVKDKK